jgi:hypothetical protein
MRRLLSSPLLPLLVALLAVPLAAPPSALAAFVPSAAPPAGEAAIAALRASLEDGLVASRLEALGVSREQAEARLAALTPAEREAVAAQLATLQEGGEAQVMVTISTVMPAPLAVGLLLLWLLVLAFSSAASPAGW